MLQVFVVPKIVGGYVAINWRAELPRSIAKRRLAPD